MIPKWEMWVFVLFAAFSGFVLGFDFRGYLRDRIADEKKDRKQASRKDNQRRDTVRNILGQLKNRINENLYKGLFSARIVDNTYGLCLEVDKVIGGSAVLTVTADLKSEDGEVFRLFYGETSEIFSLERLMGMKVKIFAGIHS